MSPLLRTSRELLLRSINGLHSTEGGHTGRRAVCTRCKMEALNARQSMKATGSREPLSYELELYVLMHLERGACAEQKSNLCSG